MNICDCATCKAVKKRILNQKCSYCGDHHDSRIHCLPEMHSKDDYMLNINETMKRKEYDSHTEFKKKIKDQSEYFLDVADGKYSVYQERFGSIMALRYGEPWRGLCGDNLVFNMMVELIDAKEKIKNALDAMDGDDWGKGLITEILKGRE